MKTKEQQSEYDKAKYAKNKEAILARVTAYREANIDLIRERDRERYARNRESKCAMARDYRERNIESVKAYRSEYARMNRDKYNGYHAKWRAAKASATPEWADMKKIESIYSQAKQCGMHVDHIVPLRGKHVSGLHVHYNLQLLPPEENKRKGNRL